MSHKNKTILYWFSSRSIVFSPQWLNTGRAVNTIDRKQSKTGARWDSPGLVNAWDSQHSLVPPSESPAFQILPATSRKAHLFPQGHTFSVSSYTSRDFFQLEESLGWGETPFPEASLGSWNGSRTHRSWLCKLTGPQAAQYGLFPSFLLRVCRTNFCQLPMKAPPSEGLMCISLCPKQTLEWLGHV